VTHAATGQSLNQQIPHEMRRDLTGDSIYDGALPVRICPGALRPRW
jgi:hypothetical protein